MEIIIIAAIGINNELGKDNGLLWKLPTDMKFFANTTKGHTVIMGRKTYESIPDKYRPLKNRTNVVISTTKDYNHEGAVTATNFYDALGVAEDNKAEKVFIIGGASVYERALKVADKMVLTHVNKVFPNADTYFPKSWQNGWRGSLKFYTEGGDEDEYGFEISEYKRIIYEKS